MQITLQFDTDNNKDSYWDDLRRLDALINADSYISFIQEFNEYMVAKIKNSQEINITGVQKYWVSLLQEKNIKL